MNREIKFRGKTKDNEWVYGYYHKETSTSLALQEYGIEKIDTHYIHTVIDHLPFKVEVIGETVGQYTGLKDKNGKKIFEGDIVKYTDEVPYTVVFDSTGYWCLNGNGARNSEMLIQNDDTNDYIEVICNIHEDILESKGE